MFKGIYKKKLFFSFLSFSFLSFFLSFCILSVVCFLLHHFISFYRGDKYNIYIYYNRVYFNSPSVRPSCGPCVSVPQPASSLRSLYPPDVPPTLPAADAYRVRVTPLHAHGGGDEKSPAYGLRRHVMRGGDVGILRG